jgi:uncharacterized protein (DUF1800 family)
LIPKSDRASLAHLLSRFTFGPRPGDIERVLAKGADEWFEQQLQPSSIPDEPGDRALAPYKDALATPLELPRLYAKRGMVLDESESDDEVMDGRRINEMTDFRKLIAHTQMLQLVRHVASERQVQEVMVDFWTNHFNVFARKELVKILAADYVERVIRPHALGRFEDLLIATARHPAMLIYLDNAKSTAPPDPSSRGGKRKKRGITENYARELLELHTLGVDGGYTQADVIEVARILTGWSVQRPKDGALAFMFREKAHDRGEKRVLGRHYPAGGGEKEGITLLRQLAEHPSCAKYLAKKLCERFVADAPPARCIETTAAAYSASKGDIRTMLRAIAGGSDYWATDVIGHKVKTPLEFLVSSLRVLDAKLDPSANLARLSARLGQPLLLQAVPTGYPEAASEWASAGGALVRMNYAVQLANGNLPGVTLDLDKLLPLTLERAALVERVNQIVFAGAGTRHTLSTIEKQISDIDRPEQRRALAVALAIGSPDFQRQ